LTCGLLTLETPVTLRTKELGSSISSIAKVEENISLSTPHWGPRVVFSLRVLKKAKIDTKVATNAAARQIQAGTIRNIWGGRSRKNPEKPSRDTAAAVIQSEDMELHTFKVFRSILHHQNHGPGLHSNQITNPLQATAIFMNVAGSSCPGAVFCLQRV
jgi:hypothetical protein